MVEGGEWFEVFSIYGRHTAMGALSCLVPIEIEDGAVKIVKYNVSRSGKHWEEMLLVTEDFRGTVAWIEISNSGKHYCQLLTIVDRKIVDVKAPVPGYWRGPCPVCSQLPENWREVRERYVEVRDL